ncbi:MAG: hypothetical protein J6Z23_04005 [Lachnospiraceae bacterium]|nr:hypothetical protein [Lachnospiraceae bacterium]MBP5254529.1 hypothetical protein [Lachnospiraceae bacterium]
MDNLKEKIQEFLNTKDFTDQMDPADIEGNKLMGILAYLSWLVLIPFFVAKESEFARFHVNQGLLLAVVEIIAVIIGLIPFVGPIIAWLVNICCAILSIIGILNVVNGKAKELPIIGSYRLIK